MAGLSFHSTVEGIALGAQPTIEATLPIFFAIVSHKVAQSQMHIMGNVYFSRFYYFIILFYYLSIKL